MSKSYTITLSDAQNKALSYLAVDQQEWIENAVFERCRIAIEEIVNAEKPHLMKLPNYKHVCKSQDEIEQSMWNRYSLEEDLPTINRNIDAKNPFHKESLALKIFENYLNKG